MKKSFLFVAFALVFGLVSCGGSKSSDSSNAESSEAAAVESKLTVTEAVAQGEALLEQEVSIEGVVCGVCPSGKKAVLLAEDSTALCIVADSASTITFDSTLVNTAILVKGIVKAPCCKDEQKCCKEEKKECCDKKDKKECKEGEKPCCKKAPFVVVVSECAPVAQ